MKAARAKIDTAFLISFLNVIFLSAIFSNSAMAADIGRELAVPKHLQDGDEFNLPMERLVDFGKALFIAPWTSQDGGGRPLTKGIGTPLSDPSDPLVFPRDFNRISAPDANACVACHNVPAGIVGGGGDIATNAFVQGHRFDFVTFDHSDLTATKGAVDENGRFVTQQSVSNMRNPLGMFGSGYVEMLVRQITADLQAIRDSVPPGGAKTLASKGISFGVIARSSDGSWNTSRVEGLPAQALITTGSSNPPSLVIRPFHQSGNVVSLRQFTNNAFNHHHGIQSTERFGADADGDGHRNELTRADVTAVTLFQATMAVPGRVIPNDPQVEAAIANGERLFGSIGCASCHIPSLPLNNKGWVFTEPGPYNPPGNLRLGEAPAVRVDLTDERLPSPRLKVKNNVVLVPAFTDFKLHDITSGPGDPNRESLDMNEPTGSPAFLAGNAKFLTRKLWGTANEPPYFHRGQFTTLRQAVLAHAGEALVPGNAFRSLGSYDQDSIIEFLKSLQILPVGTKHLVVDENGKKKKWAEYED